MRDLHPNQLLDSEDGSAALMTVERETVYLVLRGLYRRRYEVDIANVMRSYIIALR